MAAKELFNTSLFLDDNLEGYYRLNSGGLLVDSSSKGRTLTNVNAVSEGTGKFGGGADGGTGGKYLHTGNAMNVNGGAITISAWIKLNTEISSYHNYLFGQTNNSSKVINWVRYEYNGGTRRLSFRRTKAGVVDTEFLYNITLGTTNWYHIVLTYDGGTVRGYVNGDSVGSVSASGSGTGTTENDFYILTSGGGYITPAIMDDVAIFSRALSGTEISNLYNGNYPDRIPAVKTNWFL